MCLPSSVQTDTKHAPSFLVKLFIYVTITWLHRWNIYLDKTTQTFSPVSSLTFYCPPAGVTLKLWSTGRSEKARDWSFWTTCTATDGRRRSWTVPTGSGAGPTALTLRTSGFAAEDGPAQRPTRSRSSPRQQVRTPLFTIVSDLQLGPVDITS